MGCPPASASPLHPNREGDPTCRGLPLPGTGREASGSHRWASFRWGRCDSLREEAFLFLLSSHRHWGNSSSACLSLCLFRQKIYNFFLTDLSCLLRQNYYNFFLIDSTHIESYSPDTELHAAKVAGDWTRAPAPPSMRFPVRWCKAECLAISLPVVNPIARKPPFVPYAGIDPEDPLHASLSIIAVRWPRADFTNGIPFPSHRPREES